jgi:hypothetical protein
MKNSIMLVVCGCLLVLGGYLCGTHRAIVALAASPAQQDATPSYAMQHGGVPKTYGHIAAAIADQIGTGLIFEDKDGTIRFVSMNGMKEGQLERYDQTPTHGGIPRAYGHLIAAVVNPKGTGLVFEDAQGVIRFLTIDGKVESELTRN